MIITTFKQIRRFISTRSFKEIPSPELKWPLVGHARLFAPRILGGGGFASDRLTEVVENLSKEYGPIFKLNLLGGSDVVITLNPEDARTLFRHEGLLPRRPTFPALVKCRKEMFGAVGIVPAEGNEWKRLRSGANELLKRKVYENFVEKQKKISETFVEHIKKHRNKEFIVQDLFTHFLKYSIEAISIVSPGFRIHCLLNSGDDVANEIIKASTDFMDGLYSTLIGLPLWKLYKNGGYKKLESAHECIHRIIQKHLQELKILHHKNELNLEEINPFVFNLFENDKLFWKDILMLCIETFLGGIDATATTLTMTLHYLSKNEEAQLRARGSEDYLRGCIKETLRLSPTAGATSRFTYEDCILSNYHIPKGTLVSAFNSVTSLNEEYFERADKFLPERWLRKEASCVHHPFASLPFGHGPRMCPGRRIAMNEMTSVIVTILNNYKLSPVDDVPVGMVFRMNRVPDRRLDIKFTDLY